MTVVYTQTLNKFRACPVLDTGMTVMIQPLHGNDGINEFMDR